MNFLAHHAVALDAAAAYGDLRLEPNFWVGNVLPDLISMSGDPRIRPHSLVENTSALAAGMTLHFESDRVFHSLPEFAEARVLVKSLLEATPFGEPMERLFFLTHVFVEIALDRCLLQEMPGIAHDFYAKFEAADLTEVVREVQALLGIDRQLTALSDVLTRFVRHRYLFDYAASEGCADALDRICRRARVAGFHAPRERALLASAFESFAGTIANYADALLLAKVTRRPWYNSHEFAPVRGARSPS